jgi:hypothetical protein
MTTVSNRAKMFHGSVDDALTDARQAISPGTVSTIGSSLSAIERELATTA